MNMPRFALIAGIALCAYLLLLRWDQQFGDQPGNPPASDRLASERPDLPPQEQLATQSGQPADTGLQAIIADTDASQDEEAAPTATGESIRWQTQALRLEIAVDGGDIRQLELLHYPQTPGSTESVRMMDATGPARYLARIGLQYADAGTVPLRFERLATDDANLLTLYHRGEDGLVVERNYRFEPDGYLITVEDRVRNESAEPMTLVPYAAFYRNDERLTPSLLFGINSYLGAAWSRPDDRYIKVDFGDMRDGVRERAQGGWLAMVQHYFVAAWVPDSDSEHLYQMYFLPDRNLYVAGLTSPALQLQPGQSSTRRTLLYAGPKDQKRLREISQGLDLTVDYGWLWWIGQPLYLILSLLHGLVGNWGWAIVLLTTLIKLTIYPLSAAGFRSMARMRRLQPDIERMRGRYGEDKRKLAEKTMELYRERGVNPLGGCLPILIPMPVFLALYWVLLESVELRHAPWLLWISDLSSRDPYFVLPLLMGVSMVATQLMSPPPPTMEPMQRRMLQMMPVIFTVFFLWFPAGLVLYWLANNLLSLLQQWWINRTLKS